MSHVVCERALKLDHSLHSLCSSAAGAPLGGVVGAALRLVVVRRWWQGGKTALMYASEGGHVDAIKALIGKGADPFRFPRCCYPLPSFPPGYRVGAKDY